MDDLHLWENYAYTWQLDSIISYNQVIRVQLNSNMTSFELNSTELYFIIASGNATTGWMGQRTLGRRLEVRHGPTTHSFLYSLPISCLLINPYAFIGILTRIQ